MRFRPVSLRLAPAGAVLAALLAAPAPGAENHGRTLVPGEALTTYVVPEGDTDDLVFEAGAGWKFSAKVKAVKDPVLDPDGEWDLAPSLALVAPDGTVETDGVVVKSKGASASLSAVLAEGGRFALRVAGTGSGGCVVTWKLAPAKVAPPMKGTEIGAEQTRLVDVPARGGALLSWKMKFQGDGDAQVAAVRTPAGDDAGYDPEDSAYVVRTLTSESVKDFPLPASGGGGNWNLVVENRLAPSFVTLTVKVKLPKAAKSSAALTVAEPSLATISHSTSTCGVVVTLTGSSLGDAPRGVWFGPKAATGVQVSGGTTVTCAVPGGTGTVDVVYVAADGQEAFLADAFAFKPLPTLTGFDPAVGPGVGRIEMHLYGTGFETEAQGLYEILVGGVPASRVQVLSPTEITCQIPANVSGPKQVVLRNLCGETVIAPGSFLYSALLSISNILPNAVPVFGGIPVTVYGAGFNATDTVWVDGAQVATTAILYSGTVIGHRIAGNQIPPHAPGKVDVEVRDASGTRTSKKTGGLAYYTFTDATAGAIPAASATDDWGAVSTAAADANGDGTVDWIALADPAKLSATRPGTRILANNGSGVFTDATGIRMPTPDVDTDFGANAVLAFRMGSDAYPDLYLSRPGTGNAARRTGDLKYVAAFGRFLFGDASGGMSLQEWQGVNSRFSIPGILTYAKCFVYDFDFRSVAAAAGDLDGDLDQDLALVNDASINWYLGTGCNYRWQTCAGGYYTACLDANPNPWGSALRICTLGSTGGVFDRTATFLLSTPSSSDDFRGAAVAVGDMTADFLNDIVVVHNQGLPISGGSPIPGTRVFKQKNTGTTVDFTRLNSFLPQVSGGSDDWRGDAVALPDLNGDLKRDLVVSLDADLPNGGAYSTRVLVQNPSTLVLEDRTATVLAGVLPSGDKGHAKAVLSTDIDRDGDPDILIATPGSAGTGNRRTRFLLNAYRDDATGLPVFVDASSLFPAESSDPGNAVALIAADVNGDGNLDLVLTDTHQTGGSPVRRTRVWTQVR